MYVGGDGGISESFRDQENGVRTRVHGKIAAHRTGATIESTIVKNTAFVLLVKLASLTVQWFLHSRE